MWIGFVLGVVIGANVGLLAFSLINVGKKGK